VNRKKIRLANDFEQAGHRFRSMSKVEREHLIDNVVSSLGKADKAIQQRMATNFTKADPDLGKRIAKGLKL
jgi:catalase